jgi:ParB-like chromosome segregation protein Spo0J
MSLRLNPEYEKLLPKMTDEEFAQLKASIKSEGQHYPIIANEDMEVLDGHHRFRACIELEIEPDFEIRKFEDKLHEKKFVIEANLRRRHLNNFQLVELAVPLLEIEKALSKKHQAKGGRKDDEFNSELALDDPELTLENRPTENVAKKAGISVRTLERGKKVLEKASEEEKQQLREGKTSINKVYREVMPPPPKPAPKALDFSSEEFEKNKMALAAIVKSLLEQGVFCPSCGSKTFECGKCHKSLQDLAKE